MTMAATERLKCGACGTVGKIWRTCVGPRCPACPCDAEKHGRHVYDYAANGERCYVRDGEVVVEAVGEKE